MIWFAILIFGFDLGYALVMIRPSFTSSSAEVSADKKITDNCQERTILHVDLNSFFASCEQQDNPSLRGRPVGVVQDSGKRSVIIGSSKEAKKLGIGTGMPIWEAKKIYADIVTLPARFDRYVEFSRRFRKICQYYSDRVEVFSIDELFIDLTHTAHLFAGAPEVSRAAHFRSVLSRSYRDSETLERIGKKIKDRLKVEVGSWFTCSVGIAPNKMLAKLASGSKKPDGLVNVDADRRLEWLDKFELWHICGIGERIQKRLNRLGIYTIKQLRQAPVEVLKQEFGIMGNIYSLWGHGEDYLPVVLAWEKEPEKSFGNQLTLPADLDDKAEIFKVFLWLSWQVSARMREKSMAGKTVSLALRAGKPSENNFNSRSVQSSSLPKWVSRDISGWWHGQMSCGNKPMATAHDIYEWVQQLYRKSGWNQSVRFVGISVSNLIPLPYAPLSLFAEDLKREKLAVGVDSVAQKYGPWYLRPASLLNKKLKETVFNGFTKRF